MKHDAWQPCEPGMLAGRANRPKSGLASAIASRPLTVGLLAGAILSAAASGYVMSRKIDQSPAAVATTQGLATLTCNEVGDALAVCCEAPLESSLHRRVEIHLASCEGCRTAYEDLQHRGELPADTFQLSSRAHGWNRVLLAEVPFTPCARQH